MEMDTPTIGDTLHYVSLGSAGGEFPSRCRAAIVTEIDPHDVWTLGLCALNPTGVFFHNLADGGVAHDPGVPALGQGARCVSGDRGYAGGTWHWSEVA